MSGCEIDKEFVSECGILFVAVCLADVSNGGDGSVGDCGVSDGSVIVVVGNENIVVGGSRDGDEVEAIFARWGPLTKRAVNRREVLGLSHVSKRHEVH